MSGGLTGPLAMLGTAIGAVVVLTATGGGGGNGGGGGAFVGDSCFGGDALGTGGGGGSSDIAGSGVAVCECGLLDREPLSLLASR